MSRRTLLSLLLVALATASCGLIGHTRVAPPTALPSVDAAPPGIASALRAAPKAAIAWRHIDEPVQVDAKGEPLSVAAIEAYLRGRHTGLSRTEIRRLSEVVLAEALRNGLEPGLVLAVISVESSCYHRAVSPVGALGLMQILPSTGKELAQKNGVPWEGRETLFDPIINVKLGTAYLKQLSDRYDHVPTALAAYNWGPGRIDRRLRKGATLPEIYVEQVMHAYDRVGGHLARHTSSS